MYPSIGLLVNASVNVSGASYATIEVSGTMDADLSGASRLIYSGNPEVRSIDVSGASTLSKR